MLHRFLFMTSPLAGNFRPFLARGAVWWSFVLKRLFDCISGREKVLAYTVAALAVALCWTVILLEGDRIRSQDEAAFITIANNLAFHGVYAGESGMPTAYRAPGLVFFLAPFVKMGADIVALRLINALLVGAGLIALFHLIQRHRSPLAGLFSVALIPAWPVVIYAASMLYPQTLAAFVLVITIWFLDRMTTNASLAAAALAGMSFGFLILTIPIVLLLLPVFVGWIFLHAKRRRAQTALFVLVSIAFAGTWSIRNYMTFDTFIPVATSAGLNLLLGNAPEARYNTGTDIRLPEYVYAEVAGAGEAESNRIMTRAAIQEVLKDPIRAGTRYVGKFFHWFHFTNDLVAERTINGGATVIGIGAREVILLVTYSGIIVIPLVLHMALRRRFPFSSLEVLFLCLWIGAGLAYAIFFTRVRFRIPFDWLIIASNGIFLAAIAERYIKCRRTR